MSSEMSVLLGHLPGSAYHHTLSPRLHDLHEGAMVKEATLPGTLWSFTYKEGKKMKVFIANWKLDLNEFSNSILSFHSVLKTSACNLQSEVVYIFSLQSVFLAATMMDDFIRRLTQLFFCLHTLTDMPSPEVTIQLNLATHHYQRR